MCFLYEAFGWTDTMPEFVHLPLLLKPVGNGKLSKRDGDKLGFPVFPLEWHDPNSGEVSSGYREQGYLPEAVVNFLALLGWNPGDDTELMDMDGLVRKFSFAHCSKAGAKFDYQKAAWFNHEYIMRLPDDEVARLFMPCPKRTKASKDSLRNTWPRPQAWSKGASISSASFGTRATSSFALPRNTLPRMSRSVGAKTLRA